MGETGNRHVKPIKQRRSRGSRRIEAFSPKLNRRIHLSSRAAFELWLTQESDPTILTLCGITIGRSQNVRIVGPDSRVSHNSKAARLLT